MKTYKQVLNETTIKRVMSHFDNKDRAVLIITAFREKFTYKENVIRNKKLASAIRAAGFGYTFVDGSWNETDVDGNVVFVKEDSIFVTSENGDNLKKLGVKWMDSKWNSSDTDSDIQDAIVFKPTGNDNVYIISNKKSKHVEELKGKFKEKTIEDIKIDISKSGGNHTKLRNRGERTFVSFV